MNIYAILGEDGVPVELYQGQPFTSHLQVVEDATEALWCGVPIGTVIQEEVNHSPAALECYSQADLDRFMIQSVSLQEPAAGQERASYTLSLSSGVIYAASVFRALPAPQVPATISAMQMRLALNALGLRSAVETAVASSGDADLKDYWDYTSNFHRDHPKVAAMITAIGKTDADADALWTLAASLT